MATSSVPALIYAQGIYDQVEVRIVLTEKTNDSRLEQLKELLEILADAIDQKPGARDLAQLSKQYRETVKEIEDIQGAGDDDDEIGEILGGRASAGKPGAVRKDRSVLR